ELVSRPPPDAHAAHRRTRRGHRAPGVAAWEEAGAGADRIPVFARGPRSVRAQPVRGADAEGYLRALGDPGRLVQGTARRAGPTREGTRGQEVVNATPAQPPSVSWREADPGEGPRPPHPAQSLPGGPVRGAL